jgi:hypothetical protein
VPAIGLAAVLALFAGWAAIRPAPGPVLARYAVALPEGQRTGTTGWSPMAVSPDGARLVYAGETGRLLVLARDQLVPVELPGNTVEGTVFYVMPFVDGESLRDRLEREKQLPID